MVEVELRLGARARMDAELTDMEKEIVCRALDAGANVVRFEPIPSRDFVFPFGVRVMQRVDGVFSEQLPRPPASFAGAILERVKAMFCKPGPGMRSRPIRWMGRRVQASSYARKDGAGEWVVLLLCDAQLLEKERRRVIGPRPVRRPPSAAPEPQPRSAPRSGRARPQGADLRPCFLPVPESPQPLPRRWFTEEGAAACVSGGVVFTVLSALALLLW